MSAYIWTHTLQPTTCIYYQAGFHCYLYISFSVESIFYIYTCQTSLCFMTIKVIDIFLFLISYINQCFWLLATYKLDNPVFFLIFKVDKTVDSFISAHKRPSFTLLWIHYNTLFGSLSVEYTAVSYNTYLLNVLEEIQWKILIMPKEN